MAVPKYDEFMKPLLIFLSDGMAHSVRESHQVLADVLHLTDEDRQELLPGSGNIMYKNRINWAATYLKKAGLVSSPARSMIQLTESGYQTLQENPKAINTQYLSKFASFREFATPSARSLKTMGEVNIPIAGTSAQLDTPEDQIKQAYEMIQSKLADELYEKIMALSPEKFEYLVINLVREVGYGYPDEASFSHTGRTGDGGIDGIILVDKFGFDQIYIQAKHWDVNHSVSSGDIRNFYGAMAAGDISRRGIFATTSTFSESAKKTVKQYSDRKIKLIDKDELLRLMIENNFGVISDKSYIIKKVDENIFDEEE